MAVPYPTEDAVELLVTLGGALVPVYLVFGAIGLTGMREITRFQQSDAFYYRLNPATKLAALFMVALGTAAGGLYLGVVSTTVILVSYVTLSRGARKFALGAIFTLSVVWATVWGSLSERLSAVIVGLGTGSRFLHSYLPWLILSEYGISGTFLFALILIMTTTPSSVVRVLRRIGVPNPLTFSVVVGMRTVPVLIETINSVMEVQLMRGFGSRGSRSLGPLYVFAAALLSLIPALILVLRGAKNIAISTGTRAFGAYKNRTYLAKPPFGLADVAVLAAAGAFLLVAVAY